LFSQYINKDNSRDINSKIISTDEFKNKKVIAISPAGYKGVYTLGTCLYIKDNYNLDDYIYSGASAGAWNALMMTCKKDIKLKRSEIINYSITNSKSIIEMEKLLKEKILSLYSTSDFNLDKLFIGITKWDGMHTETLIFHKFNDLEDAIDGCIASSHIPFVTGGLIHRYRNITALDGGFSKFPYILRDYSIHITPNMWTKNNSSKPLTIDEFTTLFSRKKYNFDSLFEDGYKDADKNKKYLDEIFKQKNKNK
jgi:predicted patatin/cPLA2 family phospholipase